MNRISFEAWFLLILLVSGIVCVTATVNALGAYVVEYDPDNTAVPNRLVRALKEGTLQAVQRENVLVYSSPLSNVPSAKRWTNFPGPEGVPNKHLKVVGNEVLEMSTQEKADIDQWIADQQAAKKAARRDAVRQRVKAWYADVIANPTRDESATAFIAFMEAYRKREGFTRQQMLNALANEIDLLIE